MRNSKQTSTAISKKTFLSAVIILLVLIVLAGILTRIIPTGSYKSEIINGKRIIDSSSFKYTSQEAYPIWRWITAPIEVLWSDDGLIVTVIMLFILVVGGSINILNKCNILKAIIGKAADKYENKKYILLAVITFIFMFMGAVIGIFEETIPLVPVIIALAYYLGWDSLTGLGMSILAAGFGFAAAISNPFTIGVAQSIAGLPAFSGAWYRIIIFIVVYMIFSFLLIKYAKKIEKNPKASSVYSEDLIERDKYKNINYSEISHNSKLIGAVKVFLGAIIGIFIVIISGAFIKSLSDYSLPIIGLLFMIGGIGAGIKAGMKGKSLIKAFIEGCVGIAPGIILILLAAGVKHIISQGGIMDTILFYASNRISKASPFGAVMLIYLLVLVMNFFISSGSAKAFLVMPIVAPLADILGINSQITVLAFQFGDGFSNVLYPTNAVLLICLGLTVVSYPKWLKWIIKMQLIIFAVTSAFLGLALLINYGG